MPETEIVKLKIRRGLDAQRTSVVLEQGELGYTTDNKRVWVGDGITLGGEVIGNKNYITANKLTLTSATRGDTAYENNRLYQLKGGSVSSLSNWEEIGPKIDENTLEYNTSGKITLKEGGIGSKYLGTSVVKSTGGLAVNTTDGLSVRTDNNTVKIINNSLHVGVIGSQNIKQNAFGSGLTGGEGDVIKLNIDTNKFKFTNNKLDVKLSDGMTSGSNGLAVDINTSHFQYSAAGKLELKSGNGIDISGGGAEVVVNTDQFYFVNNALNIRSNLAGVLDIRSIDPNGFGSGLVIENNKLVAGISDVADNNTLTVTNKKVGLTELYANQNDIPDVLAFDSIKFDEYGRFLQIEELAKPLAGVVNAGSSYIDHYSGVIGQTSYTDQSFVECFDTTTSQTVTLTSAGFIRVQVNVNGEEKTVSIPVFE